MPEGSTSARLLAGVTGMNGPKHTQHRRLLMPAFHKKRVEALRDTIVEQAEAHVARWRPGMKINLAHEMLDLSMALAVSSLLGLDPAKEGGTGTPAFWKVWSKHGLTPQVALLPYDLPGLPYRPFPEMAEELEVEFKNIIAHKRDGRHRIRATRWRSCSTPRMKMAAYSPTMTCWATLAPSSQPATRHRKLPYLDALPPVAAPRVMHDLMDEMDAKLKGERTHYRADVRRATRA